MSRICRWCGSVIYNPIIKEEKTRGFVSYEACDEDCIKAMKTIDKLDRELKTFDRLKIPEDFYGKVLETSPDEDGEEEEITIDTDIFSQKLEEGAEPEGRFDVL